MSDPDQPTRPDRPNPPTTASKSTGTKPRVPVGARRSQPTPLPNDGPTIPDEAFAPTVQATKGNTQRTVRRSNSKRIFAFIAGITLGSAVAGLGVIVAMFHHYGKELPNVHNLIGQWRPPQTTRILARDGSVLAELFLERRTVVPMDRIPVNLVKAFLAAEDADFYRHRGLDYPGMLRALWVNVRRGTTAQGASTITQQVIKNVLLTQERTFARKVREVLLARRIEAELTKNEILFLYLNQIGFGHGRNGVEEAAQFYFGKHVEQLTLGECVLLAGIPKNPSHYNPRSDPEAARTRRRWILGQMVRNQFITQAEADAANNEPIRVVEPTEGAETGAPEVVEYARNLLRETVGEPALRNGGYTVYTTLDTELERSARDALQAGLRELDTRQGYFGPLLPPGTRRARGRAGYVLPGEPPPADGRLRPGHIYGGLVESAVDPDPATHTPGSIVVRVGAVLGRIPWSTVARYARGEDPPSVFAPRGAIVRVSVDRMTSADAEAPMRLELGPQASLVAIDPTNREVRALVGGYDAIAGMFDRASRANRQPGSSFKPFLYSAAFASRRYTLASTVDPNAGCIGTWCPHEAHGHEGETEPPMRIREALAFSRNMVAARVVTDLGAQTLAEHAANLGITSPLTATPALALGTGEVTPLELSNAYATWCAGGRYDAPILVRRIVGPDGRDVPTRNRPEGRQAITAEQAYLVTSMLTSVVDHGTGQRARVLHRPVAGKTGTSNDARDAWFVGYTPELVMGVWVGFDDRQPLGRGEEGARSALPIWVRFAQSYIAARRPPAVDFPRPPGVVTVSIDPATGLRAAPGQPNAIDEVFLSGTEPAQIAAPPSGGFLGSALTGGDGGIPLEITETTPTPAAADAGPTPPTDPPVLLPAPSGAAPSVEPTPVPVPTPVPSPAPPETVPPQ